MTVDVLTAIPVVLTIIGGAVWALVFVIKQGSTLRAELMGEVRSAYATLTAKIDTVSAVESKARHDLRGEITRITLAHENSIDRIEREMVRKDEVNALETRVGTKVDKLEAKIDRIAEQLSQIPLVKQQTEQNGVVLQKVLSRLEKKMGILED